jgi:hypothetical protein
MVSILIICALGCASSLFLKRWTTNKWKRALWGAGIATVIWVGGVNIFFWFKAPDEMGVPMLKPVLQTYLIAFMSAICVLWSSGKMEEESASIAEDSETGKE